MYERGNVHVVTEFVEMCVAGVAYKTIFLHCYTVGFFLSFFPEGKRLKWCYHVIIIHRNFDNNASNSR